MINNKKVKLLAIAAVTVQVIGAVLNRMVIALNGGMPSIALTVPVGKWVPLYQGTKLAVLADVIRVGNLAFSMGDLFFIAGLIAEMILLWVAIPQGRKFLPLLVASVLGIFFFIAGPNNLTPTILCETAALLAVSGMYYSYRDDLRKRTAVTLLLIKVIAE
jgi:hypothetical protein